jgi:mannose/fructose-specific phosphotransferase system component IIA
MTDIVIVAHRGIGEALCEVAQVILDRRVDVTLLPVREGDDPERSLERLVAALGRWQGAEPPLIMTDLPGATPHNLAMKAVARVLTGAPVLTGLNLPMLLRALNHKQQPAVVLAELAAHGAHVATFIGEHLES